ncbi:MAG: threonylcarbamoyl-AMP synthase [Candidatus Aminicenantes bacterium]|nr:threonylcarbamoyl-AMP synthase [Candidatus Aminicenantes bacterium]
MNTQIIQIDPRKIDMLQIEKIVRILKKDGVIVFPTETFYGLGASCFSSVAVNKIYDLKGRDRQKPLSVVIADLEMLDGITAHIPPVVERIVEEFWPGPLTLILAGGSHLPSILLGPKKTIGVRLPAHAWLRELVRTAGFPLTATSANLAGEKEISDPCDVIDVFSGKVEMIVDAGPTTGGLPSTVLDLTLKKPQILREGAVSASNLQMYLK